jgi:hypothetical protein
VTDGYFDIHHVEDGIRFDSDVHYGYVNVHDLDSLSYDPRADAVQDDGGSEDAIIRYSNLDSTRPRGNGNASVILKSDLGPIDWVTISNNYLSRGAYAVFVRDGGEDPRRTSRSWTTSWARIERTTPSVQTDRSPGPRIARRVRRTGLRRDRDHRSDGEYGAPAVDNHRRPINDHRCPFNDSGGNGGRLKSRSLRDPTRVVYAERRNTHSDWNRISPRHPRDRDLDAPAAP